jgi:competence protein ComEC
MPVRVVGNIRVGVDGRLPDLRLGDAVEVTGWLYRPSGPRNPGEVDWARWNYLQGISAGMSADGSEYVRRLADAGGSHARLLERARAYARSLLLDPAARSEADPGTRLLDAMILGQRSSVSRQLDEAFMRTGTIHILSVSGFHIGVLASACWFFVRYVLRRGARTTACVLMIVVIVYAGLAEESAPVIRSAVMAIVGGAAVLLGRPFCGINWLALSAMIILIGNPLELFRPGFQLSFMQVFALFVLTPPIVRRAIQWGRAPEQPLTDAHTLPALALRWVWRGFAALATASILLWLIAAPLVWYHFGMFTPLAALQSILLTPAFSIVIVLGFVAMFLQTVLPLIGAPAIELVHTSADWLIWCVGALGRLPGTLVELPSPPAWIVWLLYALVTVLAYKLLGRPASTAARVVEASTYTRDSRWIRGRLGTLVLGGAVCATALAAMSLFIPQPRGACEVHILAVGNASASLIVTPTGRAVLFDVGTDANFDAGETAIRAAHALGVGRFDALAVSHGNVDHYSGVPTLLAAVRVDRLLLGDSFEAAATRASAVRRLSELLPPESPPREVVRAGRMIDLDGARIEVLWPPPEGVASADENDWSLVFRLTAGGGSVLFTGDITRSALRGLAAADRGGAITLKSDVLIAPHHGAVVGRETEEFYRCVSPRVVVVSSRTRKPKLEQLVRTVLGAESRVLTTGRDGAVRIRLTPEGGISVEAPFAK